MDTPETVEIPEIIPVMTLRDTVFFPHSVMPLYIFEERYRLMLENVLGQHRLFAIFKESEASLSADNEEVPEQMGTVGVVRAAHANPDGTSNLALQGLARVQIVEVVQEFPYRLVRVKVCESEKKGFKPASLRSSILRLLQSQPTLTQGLPDEYLEFLRSLEPSETFIDVAIHSICQSSSLKQEMLEILSLEARYRRFEKYLCQEQDRLELFDKLQGKTRDDEIELN